MAANAATPAMMAGPADSAVPRSYANPHSEHRSNIEVTSLSARHYRRGTIGGTALSEGLGLELDDGVGEGKHHLGPQVPVRLRLETHRRPPGGEPDGVVG